MNLIESDMYRANWGNRVTPDKRKWGTSHFAFEQRGFSAAFGMESKVTGSRGHGLIIDDPHSVSGAMSDAERKADITKYSTEIFNRKQDEHTFTVLVMQRLHEEDLSGLFLDIGDCEHLMLPMRYESERCCVTSIGFKDPRTEEGELLCPEFFPERHVDNLENTARRGGGEYAVAGQYQQRPSPGEGGMFPSDSFKVAQGGDLDGYVSICRGWDLAATEGGGDYTVGVKVGLTKSGKLIVMDVIRGQWSTAKLKDIIKRAAESDGSDTITSIPQEAGAAGVAWKQDLTRHLLGFNVRFSTETGSKDVRARPAAAQFEIGNAYMLKAVWNQQFKDELVSFPTGKHDDQVDALSRAFSQAAKMLQMKKSIPVAGVTQLIT